MGGWDITIPLQAQSSSKRVIQTPKTQKLKNRIDPNWEELVRRKHDFGPFPKESLSRQREYMSQVIPAYLAQGGREDASTIYGFSVLHGAAFSGQEVLFNRLWQSQRFPRQQLSSLLLAAAQGGNAKIFAAVLKQGANPNFKDDSNTTVSEAAIDGGNPEILQQLIAVGVNLNASNTGGGSLLARAVLNGHQGMVKLILQYGKQFQMKDLTDAFNLAVYRFPPARSFWGVSDFKPLSLELLTLLFTKGVDLRNKEYTTILHHAAQRGDRAIFDLLLARGANPYALESDGQTVLHAAAAGGNLEIFNTLLARGLDIRAKSNRQYQETVFQAAVAGGNLTILNRLIEAGINLRLEPYAGGEALIAAIANQHPAVLKFLLAQGIDVNARAADGSTALHYPGNTPESQEILKILLAAGADVARPNRRGESVLGVDLRSIPPSQEKIERIDRWLEHTIAHHSTLKGSPTFWNDCLQASVLRENITAFQLCEQKGASIHGKDREGNTVLHWAAQQPNPDLVQQLIARGANVNEQNYSGRTALHYAAEQQRLAIVNVLLNHGAQVNLSDRSGYTALTLTEDSQIAVQLLSKGAQIQARPGENITLLENAVSRANSGLIRVLCAHGANPNQIGRSGEPIIFWANDLATLKAMVSAGANLSLRGKLGQTILHQLVKADFFPEDGIRRLPSINWLIARGMNVDIQDSKGNTPLHFAGELEVVDTLLRDGANPNARNYQGDTSLHTHTKDPYSVIERLIEKGTDVNAQNAQGDTPLHKALIPSSQWDHPSPEAAKLLLLHGANPKLKNWAGLTPLEIALKSNNPELIKVFHTSNQRSQNTLEPN
jgi:ankyrin repeat protein